MGAAIVISRRISYSVQPLMPVLETARYSELGVENKTFNFWEFLNSPFTEQLQMAAFTLLQKSGAIKKRHWSESSIAFKEFNCDSICKTIQGHAIAYINAFGKEPAAILVGADIHNQLFTEPYIQYQMQYLYGKSGQTFISGIEVILIRHLQGFVLLPDLKEHRDREQQ